jgi:hypothetical protein
MDGCVVIDPGPIKYSSLEVAGDGDLVSAFLGDEVDHRSDDLPPHRDPAGLR